MLCLGIFFLISVFFLYIMVPDFVFMGSTYLCVGEFCLFFFFNLIFLSFYIPTPVSHPSPSRDTPLTPFPAPMHSSEGIKASLGELINPGIPN